MKPRVGLALIVLVSCGTLLLSSPVAAASTTPVGIQPSDQNATVGTSTTYDIVVENTDGGIGAYNFTFTTGNASVAEVTDIQLAGSPSLGSTHFAADNSSVAVRGALADTAQTGAVTIATVTVTGSGSGATDLNASFDALADEDGNAYTISEIENTSLTVTTEPAHDVSLKPENGSVAVGSERSVRVTGENFTNGVGTYEFTLAVSNPAVASIESSMLSGDPGQRDVTISNSTVHVTAALASISGPNATLATVRLTGEQLGQTTLTLTNITVGDPVGKTYSVADSDSASLAVERPPQPVLGDAPPTDTDGDGAYEDINGNGQVDISDVQALFANQGSISGNQKFDINGDGQIDISDVQRLFVTAS